jgi:hypothetical protein
MSKTWSSVPTDDPEKDWSSVYTSHGTTSLDGTPSGSDNGEWMEPAGDDIDRLNENRRRLVDIGFERRTGTGLGAGGGKRRTSRRTRKSRKSSRKSRKSRRRRRH